MTHCLCALRIATMPEITPSKNVRNKFMRFPPMYLLGTQEVVATSAQINYISIINFWKGKE